jgi:hypothetical protein
MPNDFVDDRHGTYDPITPEGRPQPDQVKAQTTPRERAQKAGAMQGEPLPGTDPPLPEGLRRKPMGGLGPTNGRKQD